MSVPANVAAFQAVLPKEGFGGAVHDDMATRLINATDNSIYQVMPQAVLQPRELDDLNVIMRVAQQAKFRDLKFTMRGGGTGTNGQSLNDTLIIDTSRYLNRIIEINEAERFVRVEPGVVLDQLNAALKPLGLFFPPEVSPGKSATLGGMASTDGCGKGSTVYGKTGDYVLSMRCILPDGTEIDTAQHYDASLHQLLREHYASACADSPRLPRGISAYNIAGAYDPDSDSINLNRLFVGSEGSLVLIKELTLRIVPRPHHKTIVSIGYGDFDAALRHVPHLLSFKPTAIETIDDHIVALAQKDILWHDAQNAMPFLQSTQGIKALHFVEFDAMDKKDVDDRVQALAQSLHHDMHHVTHDKAQVAAIAGLRRKCVGLLGNMDEHRRPVPFMEDTAVPPEYLADYIRELRAYLQSHDLDCGMFGHSDAGCLHTRPLLDLRDGQDREFVRTLSDGVTAILKKYRGVLWGEHGKGMRGEYMEALVGSAYYALMQKIKYRFDPDERFNPGKIASAQPLKKIDQVPMRGMQDAQIQAEFLAGYEKSVQCNGNGMCFSVMPDDTMCPSYRATGNRKYSPKGRAILIREWLRLRSINWGQAKDVARDLKESLDECLGCKACTSTCPIHVNIPHMKSLFLSQYHHASPRRLRDYALAFSEWALCWQSIVPGFILRLIGLVGLPHKIERQSGVQTWSYWEDGMTLPDNAVVILADRYTSHYEPRIVDAHIALLHKMGNVPYMIKDFTHGKSLYNLGFLNGFRKLVTRNARVLNAIPASVPVLGVDPSLTLFVRSEYRWALEGHELRHVFLSQEWFDAQSDWPVAKHTDTVSLFLHCTEKTALPQSASQWASIFAKAGVSVNIEDTGCCGMSGSYGHEREHYEQSKKLYDLSWRDKMSANNLATGFSCRAQIRRLSDSLVRHPVELLNDLF